MKASAWIKIIIIPIVCYLPAFGLVLLSANSFKPSAPTGQATGTPLSNQSSQSSPSPASTPTSTATLPDEERTKSIVKEEVKELEENLKADLKGDLFENISFPVVFSIVSVFVAFAVKDVLTAILQDEAKKDIKAELKDELKDELEKYFSDQLGIEEELQRLSKEQLQDLPKKDKKMKALLEKSLREKLTGEINKLNELNKSRDEQISQKQEEFTRDKARIKYELISLAKDTLGLEISDPSELEKVLSQYKTEIKNALKSMEEACSIPGDRIKLLEMYEYASLVKAIHRVNPQSSYDFKHIENLSLPDSPGDPEGLLLKITRLKLLINELENNNLLLPERSVQLSELVNSLSDATIETIKRESKISEAQNNPDRYDKS